MRPNHDELVLDEELGELVQPAGFGYAWRDCYLRDDVGDIDEAHVVPIGDSSRHVLCEDCPCRPQMNSDGVWLHRAWDGREAAENGRTQ